MEAHSGSRHRLAIALLLSVATLLTFVAVLGIWAQRQALNTDNWVTTSDRMLRDEKIRTAVAALALDRVYQSAPVENQIREALPPRLRPLAGPAAAGIRQAADRAAPRILGSAAALAAWETANRAAHKAFLRLVDGKNGDVTLDLGALMQQIAKGTGLPPSAVDKLPPNVKQLTVLHSDQLKTAQSGVDLLRILPWILLPLALILMAIAIRLHPDRRRAFVAAGSCLLVAGVAVLAMRRIGGGVVVDSLAKTANGRPAAEDAWSIGTSLLVEAALGSMLLGLLVVTGAWLAGAGKRATQLRRLSAPGFRDHPAAMRVGLGVLILLLALWGPVPWTQSFLALLVVTVAAFAWLEWISRRTVDEFRTPAVEAPEQPPLVTH